MSGKTLRVLVAERQETARAAIREALEAAGIAVVAECKTAVEAFTATGREQPDVCLIDVSLSGGGLAAAEAIKARGPKIVMLGSSAREDELYTALRLGVSGYLLHDVDRVRLAADVRAVATGNAALAPEVAARLISELSSAGKTLTTRETEVLALLSEGLSIAQIARRLALPEATVGRHVSSAVRRVSAHQPRTAADPTATQRRAR
jgi:two-component system nitrate/nitrite response regulator NarL